MYFSPHAFCTFLPTYAPCTILLNYTPFAPSSSITRPFAPFFPTYAPCTILITSRLSHHHPQLYASHHPHQLHAFCTILINYTPFAPSSSITRLLHHPPQLHASHHPPQLHASHHPHHFTPFALSSSIIRLLHHSSHLHALHHPPQSHAFCTILLPTHTPLPPPIHHFSIVRVCLYAFLPTNRLSSLSSHSWTQDKGITALPLSERSLPELTLPGCVLGPAHHYCPPF
jgi:hypothetical protein